MFMVAWSTYSTAVMYTRRDQFAIPLTCTFCGNLVTTKANLSPKSSPKLPEYFQIQCNSEHNVSYARHWQIQRWPRNTSFSCISIKSTRLTIYLIFSLNLDLNKNTRIINQFTYSVYHLIKTQTFHPRLFSKVEIKGSVKSTFSTLETVRWRKYVITLILTLTLTL